MQLTGLPLLTLLQIGAVVGLLVAVAYVLKLKRRPIPVQFARLWHRILRDKEATSLFAQLKRILSLLLQLVLVTLLLSALGDPRTTASVVRGRSIVLLLDSSASMQATDVAPTRLDAAREQARQLLRGLGESDRALVAQADVTVTPLSTMTEDTAQLEAALDNIRPSETRFEFASALRFAVDALRGLPQPEIILVSDGLVGEPRDEYGTVDLENIKLSFVQVGTRGRNAAITQFAVRRYPLDKARYEVMIEVANTSAEPLDLELELHGDAALVDLTRFRVNAGERVPRFYPNLAGASQSLEARIRLVDGPADDLPVDDRAFALLPERRRAKILCVSSGNTYLEAALLLDEYLDVTLVDPASYPVSGADYDVTIFDSVSPPVANDRSALLYLNPSGQHSPVEIRGASQNVGFDTWDQKSPLLRWTAISNINIARASKMVPDKDDKVVGASFEGPLLVVGRRSGRRFAALGFDIRESDLPLRISWPLLLLNIVNDFVQEDSHYISSFATGEVWRIPVATSTAEASLTHPDGSVHRVPVLDGRAVVMGRRSGRYRLSGSEDGTQETLFAANFSDVRESSIVPAKTVTVGNVTAEAVQGVHASVRRKIWVYLLLAAVMITAIEWVTYHRRVTV